MLNQETNGDALIYEQAKVPTFCLLFFFITFLV